MRSYIAKITCKSEDIKEININDIGTIEEVHNCSVVQQKVDGKLLIDVIASTDERLNPMFVSYTENILPAVKSLLNIVGEGNFIGWTLERYRDE